MAEIDKMDFCGELCIFAEELIEKAKPKWIPVTERLPNLELVEANTQDMDLYPCLCVVLHPRAKNGKYVSKLYYDGHLFLSADDCDFTNVVTHWMPLPEPPKGVE